MKDYSYSYRGLEHINPLFTVAIVGAFGYFVYRVFLKGRPLSLTLDVPTPIPGVEQRITIPVTKEPVP